MQMSYTESIRGYPYRQKAQIAEEFGLSPSTVQARVKEIEKEVESGRYNAYAIIRDGRLLLINVLVFIDYMKYRKMLLDKNARKYAPEFRPELLIQCIGWNNRIIREEI